MPAMARVRAARLGDCRQIVAFDPVAAGDVARRRQIKRAIEERGCLVACVDKQVVGYAIVDRRFYERPFLWLLVVAPELRRHGVARRLFEAVAEKVRGETLFSSTNQSNKLMRRIFKRWGFKPAGKILGLDPGDPELVYVKHWT